MSSIPEGVFCNLDNVASPSEKHHIRFLYALGFTPETESESDICYLRKHN